MVKFENDYIRVCRVDSSNKWVNEFDMEKMWSIIIDLKKDFTMLPNYIELASVLNIDVTRKTNYQKQMRARNIVARILLKLCQYL